MLTLVFEFAICLVLGLVCFACFYACVDWFEKI